MVTPIAIRIKMTLSRKMFTLPFVFLLFKKISPFIYLKYLKENSFSIIFFV